MLFAFVLRKPLFVRHCGNWFVQTTAAEHFWKWFMVRFAGGRNVMIATGGDDIRRQRQTGMCNGFFRQI